MQSEQQQRIMGYFIEEAKDHLNTIEQGLLSLQSTIADPEMISEVFRAAHSVKGGAAMLGLDSIQQTSHRLEDYFKVLKECPVQVDQTLESLFLRVFDTLQELLEQLQGPFGLTEDKSSEVMAEVEPVFTQLNEHLSRLVSQAGGVPPEEVNLSLQPVAASKSPAASPAIARVPEESALQLFFQSDVPARLREMLQLFKQPDHAETRQALQNICRSLSQAGDSFELPQGWSHLAEVARQAIASPDNTYRSLAPVIIRDLKQAQELVLTGRPHEIVISDALAAMRPDEPEPAESVDDILDDLGLDDLGIVDLDLTSTDLPDADAIAADDLFFTDEPSSTADFGLSDALSELESPSVELEEADNWFTAEVPSQTPATVDAAPAQADTPAAHPAANLFDSGDFAGDSPQAHPMLKGGPEVGAAELNSLADLFEYEASDLDLDWQDEPVSGDADLLSDGLELEDINDFSDLLFDQDPTPPAAASKASDDDDISALLNTVELETNGRESEQRVTDSLEEEPEAIAPAELAPTELAPAPDWPEPPADESLSELGDFFTDSTTTDADWEAALSGSEADLFEAANIDGEDGEGEADAPSLDWEAALAEMSADPWDSVEGTDVADALGSLDLSATYASDEDLDVRSPEGASADLHTDPEVDVNEGFDLQLSEDDLGIAFEGEMQDDQPSADDQFLDGLLTEADLSEDFDATGSTDLFGDTNTASDANLSGVSGGFDEEDTGFLEDSDISSEAGLFGDADLDADLLDSSSVFGENLFDGTDASDPDLFAGDSTSGDEDLFSDASASPDADLFSDTGLSTVTDLSSGEGLFDDGSLFDSDEATLHPANSDAPVGEDLQDFPAADFFGDAPEVPANSADEVSAATDVDFPDDLLDFGTEDALASDADQSDSGFADLDALFGSGLDGSDLVESEADGGDSDLSLDAGDHSSALFDSAMAAEDSEFNLDFLGEEGATVADEGLVDLAEADAADPELGLSWDSSHPSTEADLDFDWGSAEADAEADLGLDWGSPDALDGQDAELDFGFESEGAVAESDFGFESEGSESEGSGADIGIEAADDFDWGGSQLEAAIPDEFSQPADEDAAVDAMGDLDALLEGSPAVAPSHLEESALEPTGAMDDLDALLSNAVVDPTDGFEPATFEMDDLNAFFDGQEAVPTDAFGLDEGQAIFNQATVEPLEQAIAPDEPTFESEPAAEVFPSSSDTDFTDDFADLDALLAADQSLAATDPATRSDDPVTTPRVVEAGGYVTGTAFGDDFAELDALLDDPGTASLGLDAEVGADDLDTTDSFTVEAEDDFADLEKLLEDADQTLGGSPASKSSLRGAPAAARRVVSRRNALNDQTMRVSVKNLDNLNNLVGELVVNRNSLEQSQERLRQFLDNLLYQVQQLSDVGQRMRDLYERSLLESSLLSSRRSHHLMPQGPDMAAFDATHATGASFDALEMDRFTGFHTLSQEMIELIVRVRESASDIDFVVDESDQITRMFRQVTTQLQEGLTRSRMVPFGQAADRLPRAVRDISIKCGKQAELLVEGRETLIDKMILEQLYDPMTHLVNNAITHGIEPPDERLAAGKPAVGKITIRTFHQGNQTVISVTDDGAGIDSDRVKRKAIERKLITPEEAQTMTRLDTYDLLFHHGFSTRDKADDFAGRGVGMDVVRTSLNEIRGVINIDSAQGQGTTFTIRLPLTLSISKALLCVSNRARIAFPMDGVEDMLDVPKERIQTDDQGRSCILWRDILLPFRPLSDLLKFNRSLGRGSVYGGNQEEDVISVVVLRSAGNYLALQVDQVLGEQEIVIKQLEAPVPKPSGIAGATVLGDGRIMPIADVLELIDLSMGRIRREAGSSLWDQADDGAMIPAEPAVASEPTVLIVDDSITVRELLSMTFNKVGYRVEQARDGQEAWEKLKSGLPCDLVFCDIEMPRMDGLELLSRLQKDVTLNTLPIAMLTSRGADRHRQMAIQLGAKGYFTKPYLEEALLDAAQRMLKGEVLVAGGN
ncbi:MAG: response regulator [Synechococcales bacterium]|nr:response regulator [Synechococcales bacterium]